MFVHSRQFGHFLILLQADRQLPVVDGGLEAGAGPVDGREGSVQVVA